MNWAWTVGVAWLLLGVGLALLIGRSIVLADGKTADRTAEDLAADVLDGLVGRPLPTAFPHSPAGMPASDPTIQPAGFGRRPGGDARETPTIPGLPVARPPVGRPHVTLPRATRHRPHRRSSSG